MRYMIQYLPGTSRIKKFAGSPGTSLSAKIFGSPILPNTPKNDTFGLSLRDGLFL
jgi:hypothetical protein